MICVFYRHQIPSGLNEFCWLITKNPKDSNVCNIRGSDFNATPTGSYVLCFHFSINIKSLRDYR